jgi:prepilin-type N-terminal cleavage/methylation domain-containing protein
MKHRNKAFTLIELLIVVAILSIMSAALIATIVAPIKEQVMTDLRTEQLEGATLLVSTLTTDMHAASGVQIFNDGNSVLLDGARGATLYHLGPDSIIRRHHQLGTDEASAVLQGTTDEQFSRLGTPMLAMVQQFSVKRPDPDGLVMIAFESSITRLHEDLVLARSLSIKPGLSRRELP